MSARPTDRRVICVVTANRADYGRLRTVMAAIQAHPNLDLQCIVAGTHVLERFADTIEIIRADGFTPDLVLTHLVEGSSLVSQPRSVALQMNDLATWFHNRRPDIVVAMGDRFDMVGVALTASLMNIPIAHIQGGEETGSVDEALRHAITKLSHLHFPSTARAAETIIRMGEHPSTVFMVGCPSVDELRTVHIPERADLLRQVETTFTTDNHLDPDRPLLLVVQHPVTTEFDQQVAQTEALLDALEDVGHQALFLWPNVDAGASDMVRCIRHRLTRTNPPPLVMVKNLDQRLFMALMGQVDCMVGNSSAGIREACYMGTPVVNIGSRQSNRERGRHVRDVPAQREAIATAIRDQVAHGRYAPEFLYGEGRAGEAIADILARVPMPSAQKHLYWPDRDEGNA